jgi:PEGA domain
VFRKKLLAILFVTAALSAVWPATAQAQYRRGVRQVVFVRGAFYDPFFYDPWFGPWGPWYPSPYAYGYYPRFAGPEADVRVLVKPNNAEVYVDGYYAGIVDDFDGIFQRLRLPPGEHEITLRLDGYRTVHQRLYLTRDSTYKLRYTMQPLAPGETTEPPPAPPAPPPGYGPGPQTRMAPGAPRRLPPAPYPPQAYPEPQPYPRQAPPGAPGEAAASATLAIRVQPSGAQITIDGERWQGPEGDDRLLVQVAEGPHRVEIQKSGFRRFTTEIQARRGETVPLNVSLTPEH